MRFEVPKKGMRLRLAVVHWLPLEQFPPAVNLLELVGQDPGFRVVVCTAIRPAESRPFNFPGVRVARAVFPLGGRRIAVRLFDFARLWFVLLAGLLRSRADVVLYFEPHSAPVVCCYLLLNRTARLFIHYHEYRDLAHYRDRGNAIARLGHWLECRWLYRRCEWISHTNSDRVRMFLEDHPQVPKTLMRVVPNYPPPQWLSVAEIGSLPATGPLRLVYVGAVSLSDTFIREVADWVAKHGEDRVRLDVYAGSTAPAAREYLLNLNSPAVRFFPEGVPYQELPRILGNYNVGLILYRGTTRNYVYNAPNKLFEYLICGLDVWYPRQMLGIRPVAADLQRQQVLELDFEKPELLDALLAQPRRTPVREWQQTCVDALQPLCDAMRGAAP